MCFHLVHFYFILGLHVIGPHDFSFVLFLNLFLLNIQENIMHILLFFTLFLKLIIFSGQE